MKIEQKKNQWQPEVYKMSAVTDSKRGHLYSKKIKKGIRQTQGFGWCCTPPELWKKESELGP